jgi:hypothetical protein
MQVPPGKISEMKEILDLELMNRIAHQMLSSPRQTPPEGGEKT